MDSEKVSSLLIGFLVSGGIALNSVHNPFLTALFAYVAPWYKVPCRKTIMSKINNMHTRSVEIVSEEIQERKMSISFDLATVMNSTRQFLVVSGNVIDPNTFQLKSYTLGVIHMELDSKATSIEEAVKQSLAEYKVNHCNIVYCATDGGSNVLKASKDLFGEDARAVCLCHILSLLIEASHKKYPGTRPHTTLVKDLVQFVKRSHVASGLIKHYQAEGGELVMKTLIQSICTRWNSELNCLRQYILLHRYVVQAFNDPAMASARSAPPAIPEQTLKIIKEMVKILTPFENLTQFFSGSSYSTAGLVIKKLCEAHTTIANLDLIENEPKEFRKVFIEEFGKKIDQLKLNTNFACASLLDARVKGAYLSHHTREKATSLIQGKLAALRRESALTTTTNEEPPSKHPRISDQKKGSVMMEMRKRLAKKQSLQRTPPTAESELEFYLQEDIVEEEPLSYWKRKSTDYPNLSKISLDYLICPSSSTDSERIVSNLNFVLQDNRSRLTSKNINSLVTLRSRSLQIWSKLIKCDLKETDQKDE